MEFFGFSQQQNPDATMATSSRRSSRFSRLFRRQYNDDYVPAHGSQRTSGACEVPIFMSPSSPQAYRGNYSARSSIAEQTIAYSHNEQDQRPTTLPASSIYSQSPNRQHITYFGEHRQDESPRSPESIEDLEEGTSPASTSSQVHLVRPKHRRRKRVTESTRQKIGSKKRLCMAFGVTSLVSVITYLVLAVTKIAQGIMFHVLSVIFIIILLGAFLHSFIRLLMLQKRRRARLARHANWHGTRAESDDIRSRSGSGSSSNSSVGGMLEKPVCIKMGPEVVVTTTPRGKNKKVVRQPPPVYGNTRESKRMNPQLVYWHKQNPSPTTPTYDEAMKAVQAAVEFEPPQYTSPPRQRTQAGSNFHPLERERLVGLLSNTMSSKRV